MDLRRPRPGGEEARGERGGQRAARTGAREPPGPGVGRTARAGAGDQSGPATRTYMISSPPGPGGGAEKGRLLAACGGPGGGGFPPPATTTRAPQQSAHPGPRLPLLARLQRGAADAERAGERAPGAACAPPASQEVPGRIPGRGDPPFPLPGPRSRRGNSPGAALPRPGGPPPRLLLLAQRRVGESPASAPLCGPGGSRTCRPWRGGCPRADAGASLPAEAPPRAGAAAAAAGRIQRNGLRGAPRNIN